MKSRFLLLIIGQSLNHGFEFLLHGFLHTILVKNNLVDKRWHRLSIACIIIIWLLNFSIQGWNKLLKGVDRNFRFLDISDVLIYLKNKLKRHCLGVRVGRFHNVCNLIVMGITKLGFFLLILRNTIGIYFLWKFHKWLSMSFLMGRSIYLIKHIVLLENRKLTGSWTIHALMWDFTAIIETIFFIFIFINGILWIIKIIG